MERAQEPHHAKGVYAHVAQVGVALLAFVEVGQRLDLVADLAIGGKVFGRTKGDGEN